MKDLTNMTESSVPPIVAGLECSICGKPMHAPKEIGAALKGVKDAITSDLRAVVTTAEAVGADPATIEAIGREALQRWCMTFFPKIDEWSAELQGAHAACVIKATRERRKGAS